jgi:hypothetical protein
MSNSRTNSSIGFEDGSKRLGELNQGLHSRSREEKFKALIQFPIFFDRYPFPTTVNTAVIRLSELFREGDNVLRFYVYQVFKLTQSHMGTINSYFFVLN